MKDVIIQNEEWRTEDRRFCFRFYFKNFTDESRIEVNFNILYLSVTGIEKLLFESPQLAPSKNETSSFNCTESGYQIVGTIKALTRLEDHSEFVVIWGDFYYGARIDLTNFEGVLLVKEINAHPKDPPRPEPDLLKK